MMITPEQFSQLLPLALEWAIQQEQYILQNGEPLTTTQTRDAKLIPVKHPEKVRVLKVNSIPMPTEPSLGIAAQETGLISPNTIGLTLRYGIFIRDSHLNDRKLVIHELVHVSQYERLGGMLEFLQQYLKECIEIGYPQAPMEQEAILTANRICI